MFCRLCRFRVRVWESYGTPEVSGTGMEVLHNSQKFRVLCVARACKTHRSSGRVQKTLYPYPGFWGTGRTELAEVPRAGMNILHNSQKFRVWI